MLERLGWSSTGLSIVNWIKLFPCHEWIHMDVYNGHTYMYMYVYIRVCVFVYPFFVFFDGFLSELDFIAFLWKLKPDFCCNNQINKKKTKSFFLTTFFCFKLRSSTDQFCFSVNIWSQIRFKFLVKCWYWVFIFRKNLIGVRKVVQLLVMLFTLSKGEPARKS